MEVHHHAHRPPAAGGTSSKKWRHYIWEFLMLFLAVFCGFLTENFREHQVENHREKQFMQSLLIDIRADSIELHDKTLAIEKSIRYEDSLLLFLYNNHPVDFIPQYISDTTTWFALVRYTLVFNDATAIQLQNAGNLRLIRKQDVARNILLYWKGQENANNNLERFIIYRNRGRELEEELFAYSKDALVADGFIKDPGKGVRVIQSNPVLWDRYANIIAHCRVTAKQLVKTLQSLSGLGSNLMILLKKEYHLR